MPPPRASSRRHYYRHSTQTPQVLQCPQKFACVGDSEDAKKETDDKTEEEEEEENEYPLCAEVLD